MLRDAGANFAERYDMKFSDASDEYPFNKHQTVYYQLTGGGIVGSVSASIFGAPLVGGLVLASHYRNEDATVCFYGDRESETLRTLIDEYKELLQSADIDFELEYRD